MGESNFPVPETRPDPVPAPAAIVTAANEHAGELEIIAQAPLTNIALALREDPELPRRVKRLWVMGGANNFVGNITPAAEFNFYVDPEAAKAVVGAGFELTLVPWDVCVHDGVLSTDELVPIRELDTELSRFYLDVNRAVARFMKEEHGIDGISHPDAIMMAMAIDRDVITESERCFVDVEAASDLTRGYSLVDRLHVLGRTIDNDAYVTELMGVASGTPNAEVVVHADKERFERMLRAVLSQEVPKPGAPK